MPADNAGLTVQADLTQISLEGITIGLSQALAVLKQWVSDLESGPSQAPPVTLAAVEAFYHVEEALVFLNHPAVKAVLAAVLTAYPGALKGDPEEGFGTSLGDVF